MAAYRRMAIENKLVDESCGLYGLQVNRETAEVKAFKYEHIDFVELEFFSALQVFKGIYFNKLKKLEWPWLQQRSVMRFSYNKHINQDLLEKCLNLKDPQPNKISIETLRKLDKFQFAINQAAICLKNGDGSGLSERCVNLIYQAAEMNLHCAKV